MAATKRSSGGTVEFDRVMFSTEQALNAVGITRRRLQSWIERGIVSPAAEGANGRRVVRLFTFRNLVELRAAIWLRQYLSLRLIEELVLEVRQRGEDYPLAELTWAIVEHPGRKRAVDVVVQRADGSWEMPRGGQVVLQGTLPLAKFADEVRSRVDAQARQRRRAGTIERRRGTLGSTPVFAGTRVPVATVQRLLDAGWSESRVLDNYPSLRPADIQAALAR